jgi:uncharacterized OB-fold protein
VGRDERPREALGLHRGLCRPDGHARRRLWKREPYCVGLVRLEEGPTISAQILGLDPKRPEEIEIGIPLRVAFLERGEGEARRTYLAFQPA